jgi:hypothetical protein
MTVEFDLEPKDNGYAHMLKYLMIDALAEFWKNRDPAPQYVMRRYEEMELKWVEAKIPQVEERNEAAQAILHGVHNNIKIEEVEA